MSNNNSGQSSLEFICVLGFLVIPALLAGAHWAQTEWNKSECAFQSFKSARLQMIQTRQTATVNGITLQPLEELDHDKGALDVGDLTKEASRFWEQLSPF